MEKKTYPTFPPDLGKAALVAFFSLVANRHRALDRRRQRHCAALVEEVFFFLVFFCAARVEEVAVAFAFNYSIPSTQCSLLI